MAPVELLDLATVINVSQAISGEMVLEKLIDRLLRLAIEHAGAEQGSSDRFREVMRCRSSGGQDQRHTCDSAFSEDALSPAPRCRNPSSGMSSAPGSMPSWTMRQTPNPFSADPYIVQHRARSVLCLPLMNQGKLTGALYLENSLAPHVFTPDRITVLKVLASQAAIALENTRLYRDLETSRSKDPASCRSEYLGQSCIWNLEGEIVDANDAFLRMVHYEP